MKAFIIILSIFLLPCLKVQAQLPSSKPMQTEKFLAYKKGVNNIIIPTTPTSIPSEENDYPRQVKDMMMLKRVQRTTAPGLRYLPSSRKLDFDALIRKYKKI